MTNDAKAALCFMLTLVFVGLSDHSTCTWTSEVMSQGAHAIFHAAGLAMFAGWFGYFAGKAGKD